MLAQLLWKIFKTSAFMWLIIIMTAYVSNTSDVPSFWCFCSGIIVSWFCFAVGKRLFQFLLYGLNWTYTEIKAHTKVVEVR